MRIGYAVPHMRGPPPPPTPTTPKITASRNPSKPSSPEATPPPSAATQPPTLPPNSSLSPAPATRHRPRRPPPPPATPPPLQPHLLPPSPPSRALPCATICQCRTRPLSHLEGVHGGGARRASCFPPLTRPDQCAAPRGKGTRPRALTAEALPPPYGIAYDARPPTVDLSPAIALCRSDCVFRCQMCSPMSL